jgi:hypothetical protein
MSSSSKELLERWLALRNTTQAEALAQLGPAPDEATTDDHYGSMHGLTALSAPVIQAGTIYFRDGQFVLFYIEDLDEELAQLTPKFLQRYLGGEGEKLRSRAGKRSWQHVYPERGVAFSACDDEVEFLEIFPPTTLEEYRRTLYQEPPQFVR